eukprot:336835-Alexandrium_andersonii.AAC.1
MHGRSMRSHSPRLLRMGAPCIKRVARASEHAGSAQCVGGPIKPHTRTRAHTYTHAARACSKEH